MTGDPHMVWCPGSHGSHGSHSIYGDCETLHQLRDATSGSCLEVSMVGVPCDSTSIVVDGSITDLDELDRTVATLLELRPLYAAGRAQVDGCGTTCGVADHYD